MLMYVSPMRVEADTRQKNIEANTSMVNSIGKDARVGQNISGVKWHQRWEALEYTVHAVNNWKSLDDILDAIRIYEDNRDVQQIIRTYLNAHDVEKIIRY